MKPCASHCHPFLLTLIAELSLTSLSCVVAENKVSRLVSALHVWKSAFALPPRSELTLPLLTEGGGRIPAVYLFGSLCYVERDGMKKPLLLMLASVISLGIEGLALPSVVVLVTVVPTETFAGLRVKIFAVVLARYPSD